MSSAPVCTGSPTFNLVIDPSIGNQYPENPSVSGYVCITPPIGYYSAPRLADCCAGPLHNITSPTSPGDPSYPASCSAWCLVDAATDITGNVTTANPYGFSELFLCVFPDAYSPNGAGPGEITCGWVNDPGGPSSTAKLGPTLPTLSVAPSTAMASSSSAVETAATPAEGPSSSSTSMSETTTGADTSSSTTPSPSTTTSVASSSTSAGATTSATKQSSGSRHSVRNSGYLILTSCIAAALGLI